MAGCPKYYGIGRNLTKEVLIASVFFVLPAIHKDYKSSDKSDDNKRKYGKHNDTVAPVDQKYQRLTHL